jgi:fibronectin-binding autotransporter adhesin
MLKAGTVALESTSTIAESSAGAIDATSLIGLADGAVTLTSAKNDFTDLADFNAGKFSLDLTDDHNLIVTGAVKTSSTVTLTTTGSGHTIAVNNELKGSTVDLVSAASISESAGGNIDAKSLKGSAQGAVNLTSVLNAVISLGAFTTAGKNFSLTDDHNLIAKGVVNAGAGTVSLAKVGTNHNLAIAGTITGSTVDLTTTGAATETKKASIAASKVLNVTANSGIKLTSKHNAITKLGTDTTTSGPNKVTL